MGYGLSVRRQGAIMVSDGMLYRGKCPQKFLLGLIVFEVIGLCGTSRSAWAKEPSVSAIELYDGASGAAYIQLADVLINGKVELRSCGTVQGAPIDKSAYGKMPKLVIGSGGTLERGPDGVLRYAAPGATPECVLPENVKFEHNASFTPAAMADLADLRGRAVSPGTDAAVAPPPLKKGVKLVFVAAPDAELAEYLLAERIGNETAWQSYLAKYSAAPHTGTARRILASLYADSGEKSLSAYQKTATGNSPSFADLKAARSAGLSAHQVLPNSEGELKLSGEIQSSLGALVDKGNAELGAYKSALSSGSTGFLHLQNARALCDAVAGIDASFAPLGKLKIDVQQAGDKLDAALITAESAIKLKNLEEALKAVNPYRAFAGEEPRVAHIIDATYSAYYEQAQQLDATKDWKNAIDAYQHALKAKETGEARDALKTAQKEYLNEQNEAAAKAALEKSKTFELQHDMIPAYEVLTSLSEPQQALVKDDIARLEPDYVTAASQRAKDIAKAYPTIQGIGDEKAVENAYAYLEHAVELSTVDADKQSYQLRLQNLGDELSAWFLDRAKHSLAKPLGSGTELGWAYLKEAESYKADNLEAVRDQMKLADMAHGMHSRLSIRIQFRDQTSQRQSEGFANQMESAIAAGLDASGMPVKVIRSTDSAHVDIEPDFQIAGDVLEHNISAPPTIESIDSKYVAGVHEIPSEEWNKLNRVYDSGMNELHTAQAALQGAEAKGNKKTIQEASREVINAQKKVDDVRVQLDATAKSRTEDIIRPYTYKKTTYNVINRIVLQFRIDDSISGQRGEPIQVPKEDRKQFVVLSDVLPNDVDRIKAEGTIPDKAELLTELENLARTDLIKKVQEKVVELPHKIYEDAQKRETDGYSDDAGEAYMRYLNVATPEQVAEREHAEKFLRDQFNFQTFPGHIRDTPRPAPALEQGMAQPAH